MAYVPTVWATGDIITAEKLNKAEQGIANAGIVLTIVPEYDPVNYTYTIRQDASYIKDAIEAGKLVYVTAFQTVTVPDEPPIFDFAGIVTSISEDDDSVSVYVSSTSAANFKVATFSASDMDSPLVYNPLG